MRLGQLARTLDTTTTEIVSFLAEHNVTTKDHPNVKLNEEDEQMVIKAFSNSQDITIPLQDQKPQEESDALPEPEKTNTSQDDQSESPEEKTDSETHLLEEDDPTEDVSKASISEDDDSTQETEEVEVIKAPKIELKGLKVVGKIDLPEPRNKEEKEEEKAEKSLNKVKKTRSDSDRHKKRKHLSDEEKERLRLKRKKAKEKRDRIRQERLKEQEEKRLKEKKRKHYLKKIKPQPPAEKSPRNTKTHVNSEPHSSKPKTILGKFWRWLNT